MSEANRFGCTSRASASVNPQSACRLQVASAATLNEPPLTNCTKSNPSENAHLCRAQTVSSRSATPDEPRIAADSDSSHGGQARNIYSQKLSGHRMMHFGKRPLVPETPSLVSLEQAQPNNQVLDLYPQRAPFAMANAPSVRMMRQQQLGHPIPLIIPPTISEGKYGLHWPAVLPCAGHRFQGQEVEGVWQSSWNRVINPFMRSVFRAHAAHARPCVSLASTHQS